jgi:hypothetical protein
VAALLQHGLNPAPVTEPAAAAGPGAAEETPAGEPGMEPEPTELT